MDLKDIPRVTFQGNTYLYIGGALCPSEENFLSLGESYAHVYPDGVRRYGVVIGSPDEVKPVIEQTNPTVEE